MTEYLRPKVRTGNLSTRQMKTACSATPPTYTALGGFTSSAKWTDPSGKRMGNRRHVA